MQQNILSISRALAGGVYKKKKIKLSHQTIQAMLFNAIELNMFLWTEFLKF